MGRPRGPAADDPMLNMSTFPRDDCLESRGDHLIGYWADEQGLPGELFARYARGWSRLFNMISLEVHRLTKNSRLCMGQVHCTLLRPQRVQAMKIWVVHGAHFRM